MFPFKKITLSQPPKKFKEISTLCSLYCLELKKQTLRFFFNIQHHQSLGIYKS